MFPLEIKEKRLRMKKNLKIFNFKTSNFVPSR